MIRAIEQHVPGVKKDKIYVFLAGPIQGAPDWQSTIPEIEGIEFLNPRRSGELGESFVWEEQVEWETKALRMSDLILFWVPKEIQKIEGRDYAQTTKIELMENLVRGKRIILGIDPEVHTRRYMEYKAKKYGISKVFTTLEDCLKALNVWINHHKMAPKIFFTSDTHFQSQRALTLSKRPFISTEDMNWTMVERWNKVVRPEDTVYHLGDFGERDWLRYLNGNIILQCGNYEKREIDLHWKSFDEFKESMIRIGFKDVIGYKEFGHFKLEPDNDIESEYHDLSAELIFNHEPEYLRNLNPLLGTNGSYGLFGHIHGRQKIKRWGIDVGVDANNFTPMSIKDIQFFIQALKKGYYDENVFC